MATERPFTQIRVRAKDGAVYGYPDVKRAAKYHPDGEIVGFQDGTMLAKPIPVSAKKAPPRTPRKKAPPKKPAKSTVSVGASFDATGVEQIDALGDVPA